MKRYKTTKAGTKKNKIVMVGGIPKTQPRFLFDIVFQKEMIAKLKEKKNER